MPADKKSKIEEAREKARAAAEALKAAQEEPAVESIPGYTTGKFGINGLHEFYWQRSFAATKNVIYDPTIDTFFWFDRGVWSPTPRAEIRQRLEDHIMESTPEEADARVDRVLDTSGNVTKWARESFVLDNPDPLRPGTTISEGWADYLKWTENNDTTPWEERVFREMAVQAVAAVWDKETSNNLPRASGVARGWRGLALKSRIEELRLRGNRPSESDED